MSVVRCNVNSVGICKIYNKFSSAFSQLPLVSLSQQTQEIMSKQLDVVIAYVKVRLFVLVKNSGELRQQ